MCSTVHHKKNLGKHQIIHTLLHVSGLIGSPLGNAELYTTVRPYYHIQYVELS